MNRIKTFEIKAEPTAKGTGREKLSDCIDATVNAWLDENPGISDVRISHSAHTDTSYPSAVIVVTYEESPKGDETGEPDPAKPRRGRPPKE